MFRNMSNLCSLCSQKDLCESTGLPTELYSRIMLYLTLQDHSEDIRTDYLEMMFRNQIMEYSDDITNVMAILIQVKEKCLFNG